MLSAVHNRSAERILGTCIKNGGLYIKVGRSCEGRGELIYFAWFDLIQTVFLFKIVRCLLKESPRLCLRLFVIRVGVKKERE